MICGESTSASTAWLRRLLALLKFMETLLHVKGVIVAAVHETHLLAPEVVPEYCVTTAYAAIALLYHSWPEYSLACEAVQHLGGTLVPLISRLASLYVAQSP